MDKPRILHCIPNMAGGGAERQLVYLSGELIRRGWDVHVALLKEGPNFESLVSTGCTIHIIPALGNHDLTILWRIMKLMRAIQPQLVQTWLTQMDVFGAVASRITGTPVILSERSVASAYPASIKHRLRATAGRYAAAIISNSAGGNQYWQRKIGDSVPKYVVHNAVPFKEIEKANSLKFDFGLSSISKVLLFAGRFSSEKNIDAIVRAFKVVVSNNNAFLILCGEGELRSRIEQLVLKENLTDRVILPGYIDDIWGIMKRADLFLSISSFEGQPNAVLEAMACGCPLVLSDIPAHRAFLDEDKAIFVDPDNVSGIAHAILMCIQNPDMVKKMADQAKAVSLSFSIESVTDQYETIYNQILMNQKHRRN
jgi:glycosyltransferase involved in cell wall biosynthesis